MGLDQYLTKKTYLSEGWGENTRTGTLKIKDVFGKEHEFDLNSIIGIEQRSAYWRKANHIHNWMVNNVQDGEDNCKEYEVNEDQLKELLDICRQVRDDHSLAEELLPTTSGFFFGGTDYDEYYFKDIDYTIEVLEKIFTDTWKGNDGTEYLNGTYYYSSSW